MWDEVHLANAWSWAMCASVGTAPFLAASSGCPLDAFLIGKKPMTFAQIEKVVIDFAQASLPFGTTNSA
jgi:hypothetical protein